MDECRGAHYQDRQLEPDGVGKMLLIFVNNESKNPVTNPITSTSTDSHIICFKPDATCLTAAAGYEGRSKGGADCEARPRAASFSPCSGRGEIAPEPLRCAGGSR